MVFYWEGCEGIFASYQIIDSFDCSGMVNWDIKVEMPFFLLLTIISYMHFTFSFLIFWNGTITIRFLLTIHFMQFDNIFSINGMIC